jgi:hypothetical protein
MNYEISDAVQSSILPGTVKDLYYNNESNTKKQAYSVVKNNKFKLAFTNLGQGSNQFVISPDQGISDVVARLTLPSEGQYGAIYANIFSQLGWGYSLVDEVRVRYGGSTEYVWSGAQMLAQNLLDCENDSKKQALLSLGGTQAEGTALAGATALLYINLPHCSPRAEGKPLPFPSDLLVQPIIVTIRLKALSQVFVQQTGTSTGIPTQLSTAELQVNAERMTDSSDLMARNIDMNTHAHTYPLKYFAQSEFTNLFPPGVASQTGVNVNLVGFRAGQVRDIMLWLEPVMPASSGSIAQWIWQPLENFTLTYNGEIFFTATANSAQLWNLVEDKKAANLQITNIDPATGLATGDALVAPWTLVKFSQVDVPFDREYDLIAGKPILNAVVQTQFDLPALPTYGGVTATQWRLHAVYFYNSSILMSRGSGDYVF